jgi:hypothetical protein
MKPCTISRFHKIWQLFVVSFCWRKVFKKDCVKKPLRLMKRATSTRINIIIIFCSESSGCCKQPKVNFGSDFVFQQVLDLHRFELRGFVVTRLQYFDLRLRNQYLVLYVGLLLFLQLHVFFIFMYLIQY